MQTEFGFREHAHTADWELEVWAPDLATLLEQAAYGMYALSGIKINADAPIERNLAFQAADAENLLVHFLSELLWLEQVENLGFDHIAVNVDKKLNLCAEICGGSITHLDKEIKAVTYHNLQVKRSSSGLNANIVFDV